MHPDYGAPDNIPEGASPTELKEFPPSTLAEGAAVTLVKEGAKDEWTLYSAQLRSDWCIGVGKASFAPSIIRIRSLTTYPTRAVPHGGYLTTVLINASTHYFTRSNSAKALDQPHAIHSALTFITRCSVGPATIHIAPLKLGRQYSFIRVVLRQSNHICIDATITHACIARETGATLETRGMRAYVAIPDRVRDCREMPSLKDPISIFRVATSKLKYWFPIDGKHGVGRAGMGPSIREQWVTLNDGSGTKFGVSDLGFLSDMVRLPSTRSRRHEWANVW